MQLGPSTGTPPISFNEMTVYFEKPVNPQL